MYKNIIAKKLVEWFDNDEHYSIVHFCAEMGMSKNELFRLADEDEEIRKAVEYGITVMEYKVMDGSMNRAINVQTALKLLETYCGWKSDVNVVQRNEYMQYMTEAEKKAQHILNTTTEGNTDGNRIIDYDEGIDGEE